MKKISMVLFVLFAACLLAPNVYAEPISLSVATFCPPHHAQTKALEGWAKEIESRSKGKVKMTMHVGGTLGKGPQIYDNVRNGIADIGNSCFAYYKGRFPVMQALDLPLGYSSGMVASLTANAFAQQMNPKALSDVKLLYVNAHGPGLLHTQKPVRTLEQLRGLKIRATGFSGDAVRAMGGAPVAMGQGGAYEALRTGVVEGTLAPIEVLKGWKQAEVVKYTTDCKGIGYTTTFFVVMNKKKWKKLPKDVKAVFNQVSSEWVGVHGAAWDAADEAGRAYTLQKGNKIIQLSPAEASRWKDAANNAVRKYEKGVRYGRRNVKAVKKWLGRYSSN